MFQTAQSLFLPLFLPCVWELFPSFIHILSISLSLTFTRNLLVSPLTGEIRWNRIMLAESDSASDQLMSWLNHQNICKPHWTIFCHPASILSCVSPQSSHRRPPRWCQTATQAQQPCVPVWAVVYRRPLWHTPRFNFFMSTATQSLWSTKLKATVVIKRKKINYTVHEVSEKLFNRLF